MADKQTELKTVQSLHKSGALPENSKGVDGTLNSYILATFFYETENYKNNTKYQRERAGRGPLGPPQNPPSSQPITSTKLTIRF